MIRSKHKEGRRCDTTGERRFQKTEPISEDLTPASRCYPALRPINQRRRAAWRTFTWTRIALRSRASLASASWPDGFVPPFRPLLALSYGGSGNKFEILDDKWVALDLAFETWVFPRKWFFLPGGAKLYHHVSAWMPYVSPFVRFKYGAPPTNPRNPSDQFA